jgi:sugar phosphate isomerase/epimerase
VHEDRVVLFSSALPGWDVERLARGAASVGLPGIEWGAGPAEALRDLRAVETARAFCTEGGLVTSGVSVQDPEATLATARAAARYVRYALELRAPQLRVFAQAYRGGRLRREQRRARAGVDRLVAVGAPAGVRILIETSPATLAPSPSLAMELIDHHPPRAVGVLYDPGNMAIEGHVSPELAVAQLGPYLAHVHVKNIAWARSGGIWKWGRASLCTGMVEWPAVLAALVATGYGGRFSIDHLAGKATLPRLRAECELLRSLVRRAFA